MKAPDPTDSFDSLSRVLQDWRVVPARAPQFRAEVWARIEGTKKTESWPGYLRGHAAAALDGGFRFAKPNLDSALRQAIGE